MSSPIIDQIEKSQLKESVTQFNVGDSIAVFTAIIEGKKRRIQKFEGTVVKMTGTSSRRSFTVRRTIDKIGVEKTFLLHSPLVEEVKVIKEGIVRRARLNYLRDRVGAKANRVKAKPSKATA
jgi:large subunit ribosomal protein L19